MIILNRARTLCALVLSLLASSWAFAGYTQVVTFGDSLSDRRNVFNATTGATPASPPYADGRFSNGPVWVEVLATGLGLTPASASTQAGTNFAWGGARTTDNSSVPSLSDQVGQYLTATAGVADPNALYTVLIGGNDINAVDGTTYTTTDLSNDGLAVAGIVNNLISAGANHILVANVPDVGGAPACDGFEATCTFLTDNVFNASLAGGLSALDQSKLVYLDLFSISQDIVANPASYGMTNVTDNCLATVPGAVADPSLCNSHLFFDTLHPTAPIHFQLGQIAASAVVPVPAALPLLLTALLGLGAAKRARAA